jgi:hypothetical protein
MLQGVYAHDSWLFALGWDSSPTDWSSPPMALDGPALWLHILPIVGRASSVAVALIEKERLGVPRIHRLRHGSTRGPISVAKDGAAAPFTTERKSWQHWVFV